MKLLALPVPPNPDDASYTDLKTYARAQYQWALQMRGALLQAVNVNAQPAATPFAVGTYSTTTAVSGTTTGTDLSNFISTLVEAMTSKGLVSPTASRTQTT